ncbi:MAG: YjbF family lipoprotein [Pseudomonadota bacterium]
MRTLKVGFFVLIGLALAGCDLRVGSGGQGDFGVGRMMETIRAARGRNVSTQSEQAPITRASLNQIPQKLVRVQLTRYGSTGFYTQVANRRGNVTYLSPGDRTITLQNGQLRMTRGLPFDLLETDIRNDSDRVYRYLNVANALTELRVSCRSEVVGVERIEIIERTYSTTLREETCRGGGVAFKNRYWTDRGGVLWKSQQWIGPSHGFAIIEKLN